MKYLSLLFLICALAFIPACGSDDEAPSTNSCDTEDVTYTNFVGGVLNESCAFTIGCHFAGNAGIGGLTTYDEASNFIFESTLIDALRRTGTDVEGMPRDTVMFMPTAELLPECTIDKIEAWLAAGKPE